MTSPNDNENLDLLKYKQITYPMFSSPENSVPGSKEPLGPAFTDRLQNIYYMYHI